MIYRWLCPKKLPLTFGPGVLAEGVLLGMFLLSFRHENLINPQLSGRLFESLGRCVGKGICIPDIPYNNGTKIDVPLINM